MQRRGAPSRRSTTALLNLNREPNGIPGGTKDHGNPSLDRIFDILGQPYRRRILTLIEERNPRKEDDFSIRELAVEEDDLDVFKQELYHSHLPKLAEAGYIDWDRENNVIRHGPRYHEVGPLVALMREHADELPAGWP